MAEYNQPRYRHEIAQAVTRTVGAKAIETLSSLDVGIAVGGSDKTTAINAVLTTLSSLTGPFLFVILPGTVFNKNLITPAVNTTVQSIATNGRIQFIFADNTACGFSLKSAGVTGVSLRGDDDGAVTAPFIEVRNDDTGELAGLKSLDLITAGYHEFNETSTPTAPGLNKARLFVRESNVGKTELCIRYNTGGVQVLSSEP